jgi:hypothetical protein
MASEQKTDQQIEYITQSLFSLKRDGEEMNLDDILKLIHEIKPKWIKLTHNSYSTDYPHLTLNWHHICKTINTTPKKIVLVEKIQDNIDNLFCETLTTIGCVVRPITHFITCQKCCALIPSNEMYNLLTKKSKDIKIPKVWKNNCENCL